MYKYTVQFEFRMKSIKEFCVHRGDFTATDPKHARAIVVGQLERIGLEVGIVAVYDADWLVLGSVTSKPYIPAAAHHAYAATTPAMVPHVY